jgi:PhnB protein
MAKSRKTSKTKLKIKAVKKKAAPAKKAKPAAKKKVSFAPKGYTTVTPYLVCRGADQAIEFYKKAFGAREKARMLGPDGKVMHAEITIGGAHIMLGEENTEMGMPSPQSLGGSASGVMLYVPNVDKLFASATAAGATVEMPLGNQFWGDRYGKLADPFGHKWSLATHIEDMSTKEMARRGEEFFKQFAQ